MSLQLYGSTAPKGQLALLSLLIIGAITLAAALSASFISRTEIGKGFRQSQVVTAQGAADSCMEEALYRLKSDSAYEGGNVNIGDGTCTITIINDSATVKSITVIGIVDKIRRKIEAKVQISPFKILSRTEAVTDACHQTDWGGSISSASASHNNGDQTGWTNYESENSTGKLVFDNGEVKMAHHDYSWTQTDDSSVKAADGITGVCVLNGVKVNPEVQCIADSDCAGTSGAYCEPGFNISGATFENTKIRGSGNVADIELSGYFPRDGDLVVSSGTFNLQTDLRNSRTKGDMVAAKLTEDAQIGLNVIKVADSSGFASRDNVMIITMYDNVAANLDTIGITNTTTKTITLASATANMSSFPASGVLKIDNEYIVYVSKDDATKTFTAGDPPNGRGAYGSTAATHAAGAQIIRWTVGQYKEAKVMNVNGTTITLNENLTIFFPSSSAASSCASNPCTQLIRIPTYNTVTINPSATLTASAYSSSTGTGGVLFFRATGAVTNSGTIHMNGRGYAGGAGGTVNRGSSYQGSSFQGTPQLSIDYLYGGGGGGKGAASQDDSNCDGDKLPGSGGGGAHATAGINGGANDGTGGSGSLTLYGLANLSLFTMGSGGGGSGGAEEGCTANGGQGGAGGGIIRIAASTIDTGNGYIRANGNNGTQGPSSFSRYGGGGAGGSVYLEGETINMGSTATNRVTASGGTSSGGGNGGSGRIRTDRDTLNGSGTFSPAPNVNVYTNSGSASGNYYSTINTGSTTNNFGQLIFNSEPEAVSPQSGPPLTQVKVRIAGSNCSGGQTNYPTCNSGAWTFYDIYDSQSLPASCIQTGKKIECDLTQNANYASFNQKQYIRYHLYFSTADASVTPKVSDVRVKVVSYDDDLVPVLNGTYTSGIHDFGQPSGFTKIIWNTESGGITPDSDLNASITTPAALKFQIAGCSNITGITCNDGSWNFVGPDGTSDSHYQEAAPCTVIGTSLTNEKIECDIETTALNGKRYARYKAYLTAATGAGEAILDTPYLQDVKISISRYETGTYELISSPFDTGDSTNVMRRIQWIESSNIDSVNRNIEFQIHTSNDGATWTQWCGPTACDDMAKYTDPYGTEAIFSILADNSNDRWFQYKVILTNNDISDTPILKNAHISYELADKR